MSKINLFQDTDIGKVKKDLRVLSKSPAVQVDTMQKIVSQASRPLSNLKIKHCAELYAKKGRGPSFLQLTKIIPHILNLAIAMRNSPRTLSVKPTVIVNDIFGQLNENLSVIIDNVQAAVKKEALLPTEWVIIRHFTARRALK